MTNSIYLILALLGLWIGTELVVRGAIGIAQHYRLSEMFIGLTILSIGSDLPELAVAVDAGIRTLGGLDASGIVIGSSIGSAFGQIGLVMGISGLVGFIALPKRYIYRHGTALLGSIALLYLVGLDESVSRTEGIILITGFVLYLCFLWAQEQTVEIGQLKQPPGMLKSGLGLALGMGIVIICSDLTVEFATGLASALGVNQTFIAIAVIGVGTSLPELTISIGAIMKKKPGLSIGNLIGSNVLDVMVPIGIAATIAPMSVEPIVLQFDLPALFALSLLVLVFLWYRHGLQKKEALLIISFYFGYLTLKAAGFH